VIIQKDSSIWREVMYPGKKSKTPAIFSRPVFLGLWILLGLCLSLVVASTDSKRSEAKALEVRVMSFNIRYGTANDGENHWKNRYEIVFDVLRNHRPDVVGLQEALGFQIEQIRKAVGGYGRIGVAREDGKNDGEYSAILYRLDLFDVDESGTFWFSDTPEVPGSSHWGNACVRICSWARFVEKKSGRAFYFFNLHLDHVSQPSREKSAVLLTRRILARKHQEPFIVTGDFNTGENNPVILYLKGKAALTGPNGDEYKNPVTMVDTFRVLHPDADDVGTFNGFKGNRKGDKIDYIFTLPGVKVPEAAILYDNADGKYPSDHFPVRATLRFRIPCSLFPCQCRDTSASFVPARLSFPTNRTNSNFSCIGLNSPLI
jgi:endonuclease/exonuclease/phosphatase family metal-dependent hydrolase